MKLEDNKYKSLFKFPAINWCAVMAGATKSKSNPLVKSVLAIMRRTAKAFVHNCPYRSLHVAHNITLDRSVLMIYPVGIYRFVLRATNDIDNNIYTIKLDIKSWN